MRLKTMLIPVGAVVMTLGVGGVPADAGQRDNRGRDRNGRESQGQVRERQGGGARDEGRASPPQANNNRSDRGQDRGGRYEAGQDRGGRYDAAPGRGGPYAERGQRRDVVPDRRDYGRSRPLDRRDAYRYDGYRNDSYRYYGSPRVVPGRPRHYYGPGGNFSVYFGLGSGYLYGSPYSGRVYGYMAPPAYGARIYYGDVRLQVRPRNAAVYVDGYYAGVVDDFDGVFQRLTLEVGPHQIELDAPGLEPQFFDIYVDPARTVNIRTDLFPY